MLLLLVLPLLLLLLVPRALCKVGMDWTPNGSVHRLSNVKIRNPVPLACFFPISAGPSPFGGWKCFPFVAGKVLSFILPLFHRGRRRGRARRCKVRHGAVRVEGPWCVELPFQPTSDRSLSEVRAVRSPVLFPIQAWSPSLLWLPSPSFSWADFRPNEHRAQTGPTRGRLGKY